MAPQGAKMERPRLRNGDRQELKDAALAALVPKACKEQQKSKSKYMKNIFGEINVFAILSVR